VACDPAGALRSARRRANPAKHGFLLKIKYMYPSPGLWALWEIGAR
jgi:hypothetical protein